MCGNKAAMDKYTQSHSFPSFTNLEFGFNSPPMKLREGNVFSRVCVSFCSWGSPNVTITHDALDLTIQAPIPSPAPSPPDIGPQCTGTPLAPLCPPPDARPYCTGASRLRHPGHVNKGMKTLEGFAEVNIVK